MCLKTLGESAQNTRKNQGRKALHEAVGPDLYLFLPTSRLRASCARAHSPAKYSSSRERAPESLMRIIGGRGVRRVDVRREPVTCKIRPVFRYFSTPRCPAPSCQIRRHPT